MLETILTIQTDGPRYGYHINPDKGTYLLGRCETSSEAIERKAALVRLVHPDNSPIPVEAAIHYGGKYLRASGSTGTTSSTLYATLTATISNTT